MACTGEQPSEGAAGGGGRNSFAWAGFISRGFRCLGQNSEVCEVQANQKSRAALVAEQQALLQEQRAPVQAITRSDKQWVEMGIQTSGYPNSGACRHANICLVIRPARPASERLNISHALKKLSSRITRRETAFSFILRIIDRKYQDSWHKDPQTQTLQSFWT